jgi:hypothetical protein
VAAAFLVLGWSSHRYWDEFFYLFSAARFTPRELMRLDAAVDLFPSGYFSGKIGHVALLHALSALTGPGLPALLAIEGTYAAMVLATAAAALGLYRELLAPSAARRAAVVFLFLPVTLYLAYKLLSEVPSLLLATLSCWAFLRSFRESLPRRAPLATAAGLALAAAMLCRVTAAVGFAGLSAGLLVAGEGRFRPRSVLARAAFVAALALAVQGAVLRLLGGSELRLLHLAQAVAASTRAFERVTAFVLFLGASALVMPFAARRPWPPSLRLAWVWLAVTILPYLAGHEPRYYAAALLPLAMVAAVGLERCAARAPRPAWAWAGGIAGLALANRLLVLPIMPSEVDQGILARLVGGLAQRHPQGTILVPWTSDYCFLRFALPHARVRLAMTALPTSRYHGHGRWGPLPLRDQQWAGTAGYVGTRRVLNRFAEPWYYVGWSYNPVMLRVRRLLGTAGVHLLDDPHRTGWHDHLTGSWIWTDPGLLLRPVASAGQYRVFEVVPRGQPPARTSITSASATTNARSAGPGVTIPKPVKLPKAGSTASRSLTRKQGRRSCCSPGPRSTSPGWTWPASV